MAPYFPNIYDDELLASAVARYHCHTMGISYRDTHLEIYGRVQHRTAINFPRNLHNLHANIGHNIGKTLDELVTTTTLFSYYFAFDTEIARKAAWRKMVDISNGKKAPIVIGWEPVFDRLRACPDCINDDIEKLGEAYWHRTHQIDSVHLCNIHATPLLNAQSRYFDSSGWALDPLTRATLLSEYLPPLTEKCRQRLSEIAEYAHRLNSSSAAHSDSVFNEERRSTLKKLYQNCKAGLDMTRLEKDITEYFGEQCLQLIKLPVRPGQKGCWVRNMFSKNPSPRPSKHIILKMFVDNFVRNSAQEIKNRQDILVKISGRPWPCYNKAADHFGKEVVTDTYKSKWYGRNGLIGFRCECGYIYLVKEKNWDCVSPPVPKTVLSFGRIFVEKVKSLRASGLTYTQIGRQLGCNPSTATNMLNENYKTRTRRTQAEALAVRKVGTNLQRALTPKTRIYVDYDARDEEFLRLVHAAVDKIKLESPPVRFSRHRIVRTTGIKISQLMRKHFYPKTIAALGMISEPSENYRTRLTAWQKQQLENESSQSLHEFRDSYAHLWEPRPSKPIP